MAMNLSDCYDSCWQREVLILPQLLAAVIDLLAYLRHHGTTNGTIKTFGLLRDLTLNVDSKKRREFLRIG